MKIGIFKNVKKNDSEQFALSNYGMHLAKTAFHAMSVIHSI